MTLEDALKRGLSAAQKAQRALEKDETIQQLHRDKAKANLEGQTTTVGKAVEILARRATTGAPLLGPTPKLDKALRIAGTSAQAVERALKLAQDFKNKLQ